MKAAARPTPTKGLAGQNRGLAGPNQDRQDNAMNEDQA
tara:strand:+ start:18284 stop:18397 length:114 start_codon:yes stop_codon:yes gene_type:complete